MFETETEIRAEIEDVARFIVESAQEYGLILDRRVWLSDDFPKAYADVVGTLIVRGIGSVDEAASWIDTRMGPDFLGHVGRLLIQSPGYVRGLSDGFDGLRPGDAPPDFDYGFGHAIGREVARLAGLDREPDR